METIINYLISEISRLSAEIDQLKGKANSVKRLIDFHTEDLCSVQENLIKTDYADRKISTKCLDEIKRLADKPERITDGNNDPVS